MKSTLRDKNDCPAPTRRLPCLVVDDGREKGKIISIGRASLTLGRDKNSGICIEARGVSRRHARFYIRKGTVKVEDLGSTNGTWQNGKRVKQATLEDGDQLQFGACLATFRQYQPNQLTGHRIIRIIRVIRILLEALENAQKTNNNYRAGRVRRSA